VSPVTTRLLPTRLIAVWVVLAALTLVSWLFAAAAGPLHATHLIGALAILLGFVKADLVGRWFMELRRAPAPLLRLMDGWCVAVAIVTIALYVLV
jgi:hypothetical protein